MLDMMQMVKDAQGMTLQTMTQGQDTVVKVVKRSVKMVDGFMPAVPATPVATFLPQPKEIVDNGFDFAKKMLDANKKFAVKLVDATSPMFEVVYGAKKTTTKA